MKIFISWSGERSQILGQALRDWLPLVLHFVEPWLSQSDIEAGDRWALQVSKELESSNFGIICVTKENIASPWILFEAGALAKSMQEGRVIPLLLDIDFKDITGPLSQFQAKKLERDSTCELITSINRLHQHPIPDSRLGQLFDLAWPTLEEKVNSVPKTQTPSKHRPQHEILEDLVASVRGLDLRFRELSSDSPVVRRRRSRMHPMMLDELLHESKFGPRDPIRFLVICSFFKDEFPWIYELGVDAYRAVLDEKNPQKAHEARHRLFSALHFLRRGHFFEGGKEDKATYMALREIERLFVEVEEIGELPIKRDKLAQSGTDE